MPRAPNTSPQTIAVLAALAAQPRSWRYGLSISDETGVTAGTLYPLLMRLADSGFLEAKWLPPEREGRPPRHAYRLTSAGLALARERLASPRRRKTWRTAPGEA